jgi:hypothetical protein
VPEHVLDGVLGVVITVRPGEHHDGERHDAPPSG